jgi:DUF4097 and DUF4098 domain-containing protein YvlB
MEVSTVNGGVTVALPADFSGNLHAQTVHGGVHSDFTGGSMTEAPFGAGPKKFDLKLGSGGAQVNVQTVNGGVHIQKGAA